MSALDLWTSHPIPDLLLPLCLLFVCFETGSYYVGPPGAHHVDWVTFELTDIHLPLPPKCWTLKVCATIPGTFLSLLLVSVLDRSPGAPG